MKTLEFKLTLNKTQAALIDSWLDVQRYVWNRGLRLLCDFRDFSWYSKVDKKYYPCCPLNRQVSSKQHGRNPCCHIANKRSPRVFFCPIPQRYYQAPLLAQDSEYSLMPLFAHKRNQDKPWYVACPYKFTQGTIKELATSWQQYRKGKQSQPRYRKRGDNRTITYASERKCVNGKYIKLPGLGRLRVRSLEYRWPPGLPVKVLRITKRPSGYYLLLVGDVPHEKPHMTGRVCGYDAGLVHLLTNDVGKHVDVPSLPLEQRLARLKRLDRKISRQKKDGANRAKSLARRARLHERVKRARKAQHHKLSTYAVRTYDRIAVEDLNLVGMSAKPQPQPNDDGSFAPNMAKAKAGLNRRLRDAGFGQLFLMMEVKTGQQGKEFVRVPAAYTSQTCSRCGTVDSRNRKGQSVFECVHCGHQENADVNAAKNIRRLGFDS